MYGTKCVNVVLILCLLTIVSSMTLIPSYVTHQSGCYRDGKFHKEGSSYKPSACEWCQCVQGRDQCVIADCFIVECVDHIQDPNKCCPVCPNGKNCYAGDKVIPAGKDVLMDKGSICRCPDQFGFGMTAHKAICRPLPPTTTTPPPTTIVV